MIISLRHCTNTKYARSKHRNGLSNGKNCTRAWKLTKEMLTGINEEHEKTNACGAYWPKRTKLHYKFLESNICILLVLLYVVAHFVKWHGPCQRSWQLLRVVASWAFGQFPTITGLISVVQSNKSRFKFCPIKACGLKKLTVTIRPSSIYKGLIARNNRLCT